MMQVNVRCNEHSVANTLHLDSVLLDDLILKDERLRRSVLTFQNLLFSRQKQYPLDYHMEMPQRLLNRKVSMEQHKAAHKRRFTLKQVVFRRILEIREIKRKPKLSTVLEYFKNGSNEEGGGKKLMFLERMLNIFGSKNERKQFLDIGDLKYERLQLQFDRVLNVLQIENDTLEVIDKKMEVLIKRRRDREKRGKNVREQLAKILTEKFQKANIIASFQHHQITGDKKRALKNAKDGFINFRDQLRRIRENNQKEKAQAQDFTAEDLLDLDYEKYKNQCEINENPMAIINMDQLT